MYSASFENMYYLGPDGSNAQYAAFEFLKKSGIKVNNMLPQKTIRTALECLQNDKSSVCVLPIENSIEGIVRETIDNIQKLKDENILIRGEITIPINHALLSNSMNSENIIKIISHPQALAQCGNYLHKNFPGVELKEVSSTSYGAQKAASDISGETAAIANAVCAKLFNLNILDENINDEKDNKTRFYVLCREPLADKTKGKTAVILSTRNKPGALCEVLKVYAGHKINLTYIDSRPSRKHFGEYLFFMELDVLSDDEKIKQTITELQPYVEFLKIIGSYFVF